MHIVDLHPGAESTIRQVATLLIEGFSPHSPEAYPDLQTALEEVRESFGENRISRIALDEDGTVSGWIVLIEHRTHCLLDRPS